MALYDAIGKTYARTRKSDARISGKLREILTLSPGSTIADIGAGTGSYALVLAEQGYRVLAVEPSVTMRSQAIARLPCYLSVQFLQDLSFPENLVSGIIEIIQSVSAHYGNRSPRDRPNRL